MPANGRSTVVNGIILFNSSSSNSNSSNNNNNNRYHAKPSTTKVDSVEFSAIFSQALSMTDLSCWVRVLLMTLARKKLQLNYNKSQKKTEKNRKRQKKTEKDKKRLAKNPTDTKPC